MRFILFALLFFSGCATPQTVRVGVIGGFARSGLWDELQKRFEARSSCKVDLVVTGSRDVVAEAFATGDLDLAALHAGEAASSLSAARVTPWVQNEFVIIGPRNDPAGVRGLHDGAKALAKIATTKAPFIEYQNSGPRDVVAALFARAAIPRSGDWLLKSAADGSEEALTFASQKNAYLVLGRVPQLPTNLEILVKGDPTMQRPFVLVENHSKAARSLARFLQSRETKKFLIEFANQTPEGFPRFYPVEP
jgi:tungstate transport system substrate-binding protein